MRVILLALASAVAASASAALGPGVEEDVRLALALSSAAYCDMDDYNSATAASVEGFRVTHTLYDEATDMQGYVGVLPSKDRTYVVFRGSHSMKNFIDDAEFLKADADYDSCEDCLVHSGFHTAETNVLPELLTALSALRPSSIVVTGHSLGAAVATLAAADLVTAGYAPSLVTFGSPRVGNAATAAYLARLFDGDRSLRVTHNADMVVHTPNEWMGFRHMPHELHEEANGTLRLCDGSGEDPTCADSVPFTSTSVADHLSYLGQPVTCPDGGDGGDELLSWAAAHDAAEAAAATG